MWQGRVPDSPRLLLIGTRSTGQGIVIITSPQPSSRNASLAWHKQPGRMAQHRLQDVALWGQMGLGDTNDRGHAQAGDTHGQGVEPFGDTHGRGTNVTRVMCNEGTQPSWVRRGPCGAHSWGLPMSPSRGHTWPGDRVLLGHLTGGDIPPRVTSPCEVQCVSRVSLKAGGQILFLGHTARGHVPQESKFGQGTALQGHPLQGTQLPAPRVPCTSLRVPV